MRVYNDQGYPDIPEIASKGFPFIIIDGGRGTGKTYSTLKYVALDMGKKMLYVRRTQDELDICMTAEYNPFKTINHDWQRDIQIKKDGKTNIIVDGEEIIGSAMPLSAVGKTRGMDLSDYGVIVWDEYNKDPNARRTIRDEAGAFFNLYETVNRNRELPQMGSQEPVIAFMLGNANEAADPVSMALGLVMIRERMLERGKFPAVYQSRERGLLMINFGETNPISQAKKNTALYRLTAGTSYSDMAIKNNYAYDDPSARASRPLREYNPIVFVGELAVYRHKAKDIYYCCDHRQGGAPTYDSGVTNLERFRRAFSWLILVYMSNKIEFESYAVEVLLKKYLLQ